MLVVGADGYFRGWIAVARAGGRFAGAAAFGGFAELLRAYPEAACVAVDIPIGLPPPYPRACDVAARELVGPRWRSVFLTPPHEALAAPTYAAGRVAFPSLSAQTYRLGRKILEVEACLEDRVVEVHPEASFRELAGAPLPSKRTWNGIVERMRLLDLPDRVELDVPAADLLDAGAAAWSAERHALGEALPLPAGAAGRPVIWR